MKPRSSSILLLLLLLTSPRMTREVSLKVFQDSSSTVDSFVEDEEAKFVCRVQNPTSNVKVIWFIRDPEDRHRRKLFYTYSVYHDTPPQKLNNRNESVFTLLMRRDFGGKHIVCQTTSGDRTENSMKLPKVKKTIPIESVEIDNFDWVHDQPLVLGCIVGAKPDIVKLVDFRLPSIILSAKQKKSLDPNRTLYKRSIPKKVDVNIHDGLLLQCFAAKDGLKKPTGNVVSITKPITVHYFKRKSFGTMEQTIEKGDEVIVDFNSFVNPMPNASNFFVTCADDEKIPITDANISNVTLSGRFERQIQLKFKPGVAGIHHINIKTNFLNKSTAHSVNITFRSTLRDVPATKKQSSGNSIITCTGNRKNATICCQFPNGPPNPQVEWILPGIIQKSAIPMPKSDTFFSQKDSKSSEICITLVLKNQYCGREIVCRETSTRQKGTAYILKEDSSATDSKLLIKVVIPIMLFTVIIIAGVLLFCKVKILVSEEADRPRSDGNIEAETGSKNDSLKINCRQSNSESNSSNGSDGSQKPLLTKTV